MGKTWNTFLVVRQEYAEAEASSRQFRHATTSIKDFASSLHHHHVDALGMADEMLP
jgi:hypothetical protein